MALNTSLISKAFDQQDAYAPLKNFGNNLASGIKNAETIRKQRAEEKLRKKVVSFTDGKREAIAGQLEGFRDARFSAGASLEQLQQRLARLQTRKSELIANIEELGMWQPNTPLDQQQLGADGMPIDIMNSANQFGAM